MTSSSPVEQEDGDEPVVSSRRPADPHDVRLVPAALAAWGAVAAGLGAGTGPVVASAAIAGVLAMFALGISAVVRDHGTRGGLAAGVWLQVALVTGVIASCLVSVAVHHAARADHPLTTSIDEGGTVELRGTVLSDPEAAIRGQERLTLAVEPAGQVLLFAPPSEERVAIGSLVRLEGTARATSSADRALAIVFADEPLHVEQGPTGVLGAADHLREGLREATADLSPQARGLVPGIAVGDDRDLPADLDDAARGTGLTHLTAVSGAHVSLLLLGVMSVVGKGRPRIAALAGPAVVLGLVTLVRPEPSVLRAAATGAVVLLAGVVGRPSRGLPALAVALVGLLLLDPPIAREVGLILSVAATAAIIVLSGPIARRLSLGLPRWLARGLAIPAAAQLACGPVIVLLDPRLAMTAVPANVLAAPAVPGATVLGLLSAAVSPVWAGGAETLARVAGWHTAWIAWVARTLAGAPGASLPLPAGVLGAGLLAGGTVVGVLVLARLARTATRVRVAAVVCVLPGLVAIAPAVPGTGSPVGWILAQCDVGQAAALLVRTGESSAVLVDAGNADGAAARCVDEAGIDRLDAVLLTHDHADHTGGLAQVLTSVPVDQVLVPRVVDDGTAATAAHALDEARSLADVLTVGEGDAFLFGPVVATVLLPTVGTAVDPADSSSVNEASIGMHLTVPTGEGGAVTVLVTGDLEAGGQRRLAGALRERGLGRVDVVVVPHHGSGNLDPVLARVTGPLLALVSVGADNDFGHPAAAALETWRSARVARTDLCGPIWVVPADRGRLAIAGCDGEGGPPDTSGGVAGADTLVHQAHAHRRTTAARRRRGTHDAYPVGGGRRGRGARRAPTHLRDRHGGARHPRGPRRPRRAGRPRDARRPRHGPPAGAPADLRAVPAAGL